MKTLSIGAAVLLLVAAAFAFPVNPLVGVLSLAAAACSVATHFVYKRQARDPR